MTQQNTLRPDPLPGRCVLLQTNADKDNNDQGHANSGEIKKPAA